MLYIFRSALFNRGLCEYREILVSLCNKDIMSCLDKEKYDEAVNDIITMNLNPAMQYVKSVGFLPEFTYESNCEKINDDFDGYEE